MPFEIVRNDIVNMQVDAVITSGFGLDAKYVIHTVGPIWEDGNHGEEQILPSCYRKSLAVAKEYECESIAFSLITTGNYGFPKPLALQLINRTRKKDSEIYKKSQCG